MRWLFSAYKATQRFLISKQYHPHGISGFRYLHASGPIGWSKSYQMHPSYSYSGQLYSTSTTLKNVDLEIISIGTIKPSSPTPHHLRTFNLSIIDQYMFDIYTRLILFFPNTDNTSVTNVVAKRSKHLKDTLSKILTQFYPFAGKVKDNLQIECNDEGVYYIETKVNHTLKDFICHPQDEEVEELLPKSPCTAESSVGNYVIGIQVNMFSCGGIAISTTFSHKIFDAHTVYLFMKAWAAAARGSPETILPSFNASKIFPNNPSLEYSLPSKLLTTETLIGKRFVFDTTALASLKAHPINSTSSSKSPTRVEATTCLIWKVAAKAASKVRPFGPQSPHFLSSTVNIRKRSLPPFSDESAGNLIDFAGVICFPERGMDLATMMGELRDSIAMINSDHIESLKGEKGHGKINEMLRRSKELMDVIGEGDTMLATSLLNSGMYDVDFGWGKPIWFYGLNPGMSRLLALNETLEGGGVEAIVTLSPEEMQIFECDPELLSYATVNPSPLRFIKH